MSTLLENTDCLAVFGPEPQKNPEKKKKKTRDLGFYGGPSGARAITDTGCPKVSRAVLRKNLYVSARSKVKKAKHRSHTFQTNTTKIKRGIRAALKTIAECDHGEGEGGMPRVTLGLIDGVRVAVDDLVDNLLAGAARAMRHAGRMTLRPEDIALVVAQTKAGPFYQMPLRERVVKHRNWDKNESFAIEDFDPDQDDPLTGLEDPKVVY